MTTEKFVRLSIIIPTFNAKGFVVTCIGSILKSRVSNYEIILVDNGSTDDTLNHLKIKFAKDEGKINYIRLEKNYGPAKARNCGARQARGKYICFLDSDTIVDPNWADVAIKCLTSKPKVAAVQCKLLFLGDKKRIDYVGEYLSNTGFLTQLAYCGEKDRGQFDSEKEILAAKSAGMFVTREAFEIVGGFDEDYFIFVEETDLGWRLWLGGYRVILCPRSVVYHHFSATKDIVDKSFNNYLVRFHGTKNYILTLYKNLSLVNLVKILPIHLLLWFGLSSYLMVTGNFRSGWNIIRGIFWQIPNLFANTRKRLAVQTARRVSDEVLFEDRALMKTISITSLVKKFIGSQNLSITPENKL